jgi:hypothetical protein
MQRLKSALVAVALLLAGGVFITVAIVRSMPIDEDAAYVGSVACEGCHAREHADWASSLHTKMMRPVDGPGVLVADLHDPGVRFDRADAVWAIGGKWEQQLMGHDGDTETLLAGAWSVSTQRWDFKGWDGWQLPVPLRRCHGCHTVGLDVETGRFVEPNIGCESCHGPGGWHVSTWGLGRLHSSADAQICGQCHARGTTADGALFFPYGYRPGAELVDFFVEEQPSVGQTTGHWWGNGFERNRHQEYTAWSGGGHAESLDRLRDKYDGRYGVVSDACLDCHSGDYILAPRRGRPSVETARYGVTCAVCHNVHGRLDEPALTCGACHGAGAFYHRAELNASHVACGADAGVGCVGCHMPLVGKIGGTYMLHSHRPGVVSPEDSVQYGMPNSCMNGSCHPDATLEWALSAYSASYGAQGASTPAHGAPAVR